VFTVLDGLLVGNVVQCMLVVYGLRLAVEGCGFTSRPLLLGIAVQCVLARGTPLALD
jgi:hypothetical protein